MIVPKRAAVRPRVHSPGSGEVLLLEDEIKGLLEAGARGVVAVVGPPGSGKTTALQHLAAVLPKSAPLMFLEEPGLAQLFTIWPDYLVIWVGPEKVAESLPTAFRLTTYRLAPWRQDDLIEYLLNVHKPHCASVMARLHARDYSLLGGNPELWQIVLDRLAADDKLGNARRALHRYLEEHLADTDLLERARSACLNALVVDNTDLSLTLEKLARPGFAGGLMRALRHAPAQLILAAERVAADLQGDADCDYLARRLPRDLVRTAARFIARDGRALEHLHRLLAGPAWSHAMSVSLLHATETGCILANVPRTLAGAYLDGILWARVHLAGADLTEADLSGAHLNDAELTLALAARALFSRATLTAATLDKLVALQADFSRADLSRARAESACFDGANLQGANLQAAQLSDASFRDADLTGATFRAANLARVNLLGAELKEADFTDANLEGALLKGLVLREARWEGASFALAQMSECDLEYLRLPRAVFKGADLGGAYLTGSVMPGANFENACLKGAGLADVEWEGASLRGADLRGATFHMGSSRSGLVGSPIACEGSRTGFYTDDYDEQTYKSPEEIRKANLCGADLRDTLLDGVDFYLVDLRGALYDPELEPYLRSSGAILEASV